MIKNNKGFSLIEVLLGVAIIISVTTVVLSMIVSTFRISNKTNTNSVVRQNGNYAMNELTRQLQFADSFEGVSVQSGVSVDSYRRCDDVLEEVNHIKFKHKTKDRYITCDGSRIEVGDGTTMTTSIDTARFDVTNCELTCKQDSINEGPIVGISFDLATKNLDTTLVENKNSQSFSTTVKMRNP